MKLPLVTCVCNTRNRPRLLKRSIECFKAQTYPNKELLIAYEDDDFTTHALLEKMGGVGIRVLRVPSKPKLTLGGLRNLAIGNTNGRLLCIWDDDDWFHTDRLTIQVNSILSSHKPACLMAYILIFNSLEKQAYMGQMRMWEGSMMCTKATISKGRAYGNVDKGEDTILVDQILKNNLIYPLIRPQLYIYEFHGSNTWGIHHFDHIYRQSQRLSVETSQMIGSILDGKYSPQEGSKLLDSREVLSELRYVKVGLVNL